MWTWSNSITSITISYKNITSNLYIISIFYLARWYLYIILKAVVIHHTLNSPRGESSFAIETIHSLSKLGYDSELVMVQKPNLELISKTYGKELPVKNVRFISPFKWTILEYIKDY